MSILTHFIKVTVYVRYESQLVEACVDSEEDCVEPELGAGPGPGAGQLREVPDSETIAICDTRYDHTISSV